MREGMREGMRGGLKKIKSRMYRWWNSYMDIPGFKVHITPLCVKNHGEENRVNYAFELLKERIIKSLKAYPDNDVVVTYYIKEKPC